MAAPLFDPAFFAAKQKFIADHEMTDEVLQLCEVYKNLAFVAFGELKASCPNLEQALDERFGAQIERGEHLVGTDFVKDLPFEYNCKPALQNFGRAMLNYRMIESYFGGARGALFRNTHKTYTHAFQVVLWAKFLRDVDQIGLEVARGRDELEAGSSEEESTEDEFEAHDRSGNESEAHDRSGEDSSEDESEAPHRLGEEGSAPDEAGNPAADNHYVPVLPSFFERRSPPGGGGPKPGRGTMADETMASVDVLTQEFKESAKADLSAKIDVDIEIFKGEMAKVSQNFGRFTSMMFSGSDITNKDWDRGGPAPFEFVIPIVENFVLSYIEDYRPKLVNYDQKGVAIGTTCLENMKLFSDPEGRFEQYFPEIAIVGEEYEYKWPDDRVERSENFYPLAVNFFRVELPLQTLQALSKALVDQMSNPSEFFPRLKSIIGSDDGGNIEAMMTYWIHAMIKNLEYRALNYSIYASEYGITQKKPFVEMGFTAISESWRCMLRSIAFRLSERVDPTKQFNFLFQRVDAPKYVMAVYTDKILVEFIKTAAALISDRINQDLGRDDSSDVILLKIALGANAVNFRFVFKMKQPQLFQGTDKTAFAMMSGLAKRVGAIDLKQDPTEEEIQRLETGNKVFMKLWTEHQAKLELLNPNERLYEDYKEFEREFDSRFRGAETRGVLAFD